MWLIFQIVKRYLLFFTFLLFFDNELNLYLFFNNIILTFKDI